MHFFNAAVYGCEKVMEKELFGSTQEAYHRIVPHYHHHLHHPLSLPSHLNILPALIKNPVGLFNFLFCFFFLLFSAHCYFPRFYVVQGVMSAHFILCFLYQKESRYF